MTNNIWRLTVGSNPSPVWSVRKRGGDDFLVHVLGFNNGTIQEGVHFTVYTNTERSITTETIDINVLDIEYSPLTMGISSIAHIRGGFGAFVRPGSNFSSCDTIVRKNVTSGTTQTFSQCAGRMFYVQYNNHYSNGSTMLPEFIIRLKRASTTGITIPAKTALFSITMFNFGQPNPSLIRLGRTKMSNGSVITTAVTDADLSDLAFMPIWSPGAYIQDDDENISTIKTEYLGQAREALQRSPIILTLPGSSNDITSSTSQADRDAQNWLFMGSQLYNDSVSSPLDTYFVELYARAGALTSLINTKSSPASVASAIKTSGSARSLTAAVVVSSASNDMSMRCEMNWRGALDLLVCLDQPSAPSTVPVAPSWTLDTTAGGGTTRQNAFAICVGISDNNTHLIPSSMNAAKKVNLLQRKPTMVYKHPFAAVDFKPVPISRYDPAYFVIRRSSVSNFVRIPAAAIWVRAAAPCLHGQWPKDDAGACAASTAMFGDQYMRETCDASNMMRLESGACIPLGRTSTDTPKYKRVVYTNSTFSCAFDSPTGLTRGNPQTIEVTDSSGDKWIECKLPSCESGTGKIFNAESGVCECPVDAPLKDGKCVLSAAATSKIEADFIHINGNPNLTKTEIFSGLGIGLAFIILIILSIM